MKFVPSEIPSMHRPVAQKALDLCIYYLKLEEFRDDIFIRFFQAVEDNQDDEKRFHTVPMNGPECLYGVCRSDILSDALPEVWIRSDLSLADLIYTIGHEMHHCKEHLIQDHSSEAEADNFGRFILQQYLKQSGYTFINTQRVW